MSKYYVLKGLNHDKKEYVVGEEVELTDEQAEVLLADGVIGEDAPEIEEEETAATPKKSAKALTAAQKKAKKKADAKTDKEDADEEIEEGKEDGDIDTTNL